jgi:TP901 family phage tail tape measure protein
VSEVHRASSSLQQLQRELLASNRAISASTKLANNLFRDTLTGSGQFSSHFVNLNSDVDKFGKNLDAGRLKLKNYFQTFREHATTQKGMIRELAKEQVMLQNSVLQPLGRNAQGLMQYNVMIPRGLDAVKNSAQLARMELQIMNRALSEGAGSLINWGKNTQWAGRQLTVGLTVPLTMFGAAAGKAFREADQELVRLTKVYGGLAASSSADLKAIREEVIQTAKSLSQTMGASFKDTIALGADIAATGKMGNELLGSIEETTRLSILGEVDRQDAMKATLSIQTAFKQNTEQLTESINFLNAVENQTSTTLNDLVEAIPKAGPVIQQLGGSIEDLALYMTAMREGGINASEGANALKSGLASLINPTKQTIGMMSDFGIDVMGMVAKNTGNTTGMLTDLQAALNTLDPLSKARALEQMFGKFQFARMSALLNNLGKEGSQTLQVMDLMKASTSDLAGIAERELGMITESASGKYRKAMESLKAELASVGEEFLGIGTKILNAASKILNFFTELPTPIKKALTFMAGFTALVGPLIMLTGVLANFFGYITKGIVQLRSFFMRANGWKMLTPEIIAAQKAAEMVENAFYSDAAAAQVLHNALQKLVLDYQNLQAASMKSAVPVNAGVSTVAGNTVVAPAHGRRVVDPNDPYVGDPNTRAMSHIRPRDLNNPATLLGGVPGAIPVNRGISRTPQIYMHDRLPNVEGLTSVKGISTGIVAPEAAKFHALMATLGMQTEQEVANLKKTIAMGGTVSRELLDTFDDILPITQRFADSAATQSALIVQQMRNAEITVDQAKARILALNAQIEADMGSAVTAYAAGRGRRIDLTRAPMMDQPVVDANGQFTLRDLYKKKTNASVMEEFGRLRGVRTFGAPYSIQTTRMPKFNDGGGIESFGPGKTTVSGPSSISYDDRLGSVPVGGYVLNQSASMDPANAPLVAMASATYENGGEITAALTPRETVFGPKIQRMPELYAAVDAANSGYNFGGQIMNGVTGYGKKTGKTPQVEDKAYYKRRLKEYLRFINNPRYADDIRIRMIMLDAAELAGKAKMPIDKAINIATSNFDKAIGKSGGSIEKFIDVRIKQVQGLEGKFPGLKLSDSANTRSTGGSLALNYELNNVRAAMLKNRKFKDVFDLIEGVTPTDIKNAKGMPYIEGLHARGHITRHGNVGYATSGHMGVAAVIPSGINSIMARLQDIGISPDILHLRGEDARKNFEVALKSVGMSKMTTVDDIATALEDNNLFKSKSQIESGSVVRATQKQRNDLQMFLEAVMSRKKWMMIPRGRPPVMMPVLAKLNKGGMIPGGSISRGRSNYGVVAPALKLLAPDKQLKILAKARELSSRGSLGKFADTPVTEYGHQISASSGMSYPIPGVSGLYKVGNKKVFVKGVPNELTAVHEPIGTDITRRLFRIESPVQTARTVVNPLDPKRKSKLLALESDFDPRFANTNVPWDEDTVIRQLANSLLMNNKDLSRSNVYGNFNPDVGNAGVFKAASGNTALAKADEMNSMEKQAMINLLAVKGGARKDFARDTAEIVRKMTPKKYGRLMKKTLEQARPELVKIINELPVGLRPPYEAMLKRLDDGIEVDWSKYHSVHSNPTYLNAGGPIGGGPIKRGRHAYGPKKGGSRRPGNPAARAAQEKARAERVASYTPSGGSSYTATGNPQMQVTRVPYVGGAGVRGNAYTGEFTPSAARTISTMRLAQFPRMSMPTMPMNIPGIGNTAAISAAFASMGNSIKKDSIQLAKAINFNTKYIASSLKDTVTIMGNNVKTFATNMNNSARAAVTSTLNFAKRARNAIIREQNAYAAARYPAGQAPAQGLFGPGLVGAYKNTGVDGVQSRKVGSLGMRRTEYLVNNESTGGKDVVMSRKQAKAAGVPISGRGPMGMGAQMGIGMAGSMGGMALMSKEKVNIGKYEMSGMSAGMGLMAASSILPFLPFGKMGAGLKSAASGAATLAKGFNAARQAGTVMVKIIPAILRLAKGFGPIGLVVSALSIGLKIYKDYKDAQQDASMGLSMTAKAAEQAGVKYFNLKETMQGYIEKTQLAAAAAKASANNSIGMPGLPKSIEELKKAKEEGKGLKDLIESLNRSESTAETQRLINNQKAQMVAAGMSIEEANKKIYGALANSNKSKEVYQLLADKGFAAITDKATAAEFAVGNLVNTLDRGDGTADWGKEVGNGFEGLINVFQNATASLVGTKDALGNVVDEYKAYELVMSKAEQSNPGINEAIGEEAYDNLAKTQPLLASITNEADSIKGILAKWKLFTSGINVDLSKIDSTLAIKLAGFNSAVDSGVSALTKAADDKTTFGTMGKAYSALQKTIAATSAAAQRANAASQRSAQEELKIIAKKIKLIEDEKNKKLESLRATQDASNYALELQKLQIEYADAVARGDMATAAQARINIDQLTMNRQSDLAVKAIEDAAAKAKAPLEKDAEGIQDRQDKKTVTFQNNQDNSAVATEISDKLQKFQSTFNALATRGTMNELEPDAIKKAEEERKIQAEFIAFVKEVQAAYVKGGSTLKKTLETAFPDYFSKGKPIPVETVTKRYNGSSLETTATPNQSILNSFKDDVKALAAHAELITGGTTIKQLSADIKKALGYKDKPGPANTTSPLQANSTNKAADLKTLGRVGGPTVNQVTTDPSTGTKELLKEGIFETSLLSFNKGGRGLTEGSIVLVGEKGGIRAVVTDSVKPKTSGELRIIAIDRNTQRVQFAVNKAAGGYVSGPGTPTSDSIPAMLSNGEYVISARAVQAAGVPMLDNINRMASGGMVKYNVPKMSSGGRVRFNEGGLASSSSSMYNINVQLNGTNLTADDVAASIHKEMRLREMAAGVNRRVGS